MALFTFKFSPRVTSSIDNYRFNKGIISAAKSDPKLRKEISKVFQAANRRIQNIERADVFSPAVASLGKSHIDRFSKFGMRGKSWRELKKEYGKAISFLQQPTSTATGAKQFARQVKGQLDITDAQWKSARKTLTENYNAITADLMETLPYKKLVQEMYSETVTDVSDQIENDAKKISNGLEKAVQDLANNTKSVGSFLDWFDISE